ncbi:MAG TPA: hypothetical protein VHC43_15135 [Mycobacteriales bacterium]|nr:hypothetical protein [Mycobacteriales bacterium]
MLRPEYVVFVAVEGGGAELGDTTSGMVPLGDCSAAVGFDFGDRLLAW